MAINNKINELIKEFIYIIYTENYYNDTNNTFIERYVAKHPLLKPELIIINDQIQGFKKVSKKVTSLEEFPIYLEIEGICENKDSYLIDSIDLYSETSLNCQKRLTDIIYVTNLFNHYISFERTIDVSNPKEESIIITSKIQDYLIIKSETEKLESLTYNDLIEKNNNDLVMNLNQFKAALKIHLNYFVEFIKICHDILIEDIPLKTIKTEIEAFLEKNK